MLKSKLLSYFRVRTPPELPFEDWKFVLKCCETEARTALVSLSLGCPCIALPDAVREGVTSVMPHVLRGAL